MKLLLFLLLSLSSSLFSMELKQTCLKKIPYELLEEDVTMPDGQKMRVMYDEGRLNFVTFNQMNLTRNASIGLSFNVLEGLKNISVRGFTLLPENGILSILLGTKDTANDSVIFSMAKMPDLGGSCAVYKGTTTGVKAKFVDFKIYDIPTEKIVYVKAFSKVSKECKKYYFVLKLDETLKIIDIIVATKEYKPKTTQNLP